MDLVQKVIDVVYDKVPIHTRCPHCDSDTDKDMIISKDMNQPQWRQMAQEIIDKVKKDGVMEQLKVALKCFTTSIVATEPVGTYGGHIFCHLQCEPRSGCKDMNFCLSIKRLVEEELNERQKT